MKCFDCLIVDDEPIAIDIIKNYCSHLPVLRITATCGNALEAKKILQEQSVHILFLDIQMPVLDGIKFIHTLKNPPQIIFTTAYKEYAVEAFDLAACDYLVKPFSLERFIIAVDKALGRLNVFDEKFNQTDIITENNFFIKTDGRIYNIKYDELLYAEAKGNVTKIVTKNGTIKQYISFADFENMLPNSLFIRIHRSFIINKSKINHIVGNQVVINGTNVPIGNTYKQSFLKSIGL